MSTNIDFDQHFLKEEFYLDEITSAIEIKESDEILEIGPGKGALTQKILEQKPKKLTSVEIDIKLKSELEKLKEKYTNFELVSGSILKYLENVSMLKEVKNEIAIKLLDEFQNTKLVGNIPYGITEPLYDKILDLKPKFCVFLQGKAFTKVLQQKDCSKWFHFVNSFYNFEVIDEVDGDAFEPKTKVKSSIIRLKLKTELTEKDKFFQKIYEKRDRNTKNALIFTLVDCFGMTKQNAQDKVLALNLEQKTLEKPLKVLSNEEFGKIRELL